MAIRTLFVRPINPAGRPDPSAPSSTALRRAGRQSASSFSPVGLSATLAKPWRSSSASGSSPRAIRANGTSNAAPTDTRIALRYSGSQQSGSRGIAFAPKAAVLRKIPLDCRDWQFPRAAAHRHRPRCDPAAHPPKGSQPDGRWPGCRVHRKTRYRIHDGLRGGEDRQVAGS